MAMEDFRVDVVVGKGPGATAIPLELAAVHPGRRHHPGRAAAGAAARPVRLHRAHGLLRARRARARPAPLGRAARTSTSTPTAPPRSPAAPGARRGSPTGCCAGSATTPRSGPTASDHPGGRARRRSQVYDVDAARPRPARPRRARRAARGGSAGGRSGCRRSRWRWGRSPRRSRRWPSRSWSGRGCWRVPRAAGSPPRRPGPHLGTRTARAGRDARAAGAVRPVTARALVARGTRVQCWALFQGRGFA